MCLGGPISRDADALPNVPLAGSRAYTKITYSPSDPQSGAPTVKALRGFSSKVRGIGITIRQRGEQLLRRTGQIPHVPRSLRAGPLLATVYAGSSTTDNRYPPQPAQETLLVSILNAIELTTDTDAMSLSTSVSQTSAPARPIPVTNVVPNLSTPRPQNVKRKPAPTIVVTNDAGLASHDNPELVGIVELDSETVNAAPPEPIAQPKTAYFAAIAEAEDRYSNIFAGSSMSLAGTVIDGSEPQPVSKVVPALAYTSPPYPTTPTPVPSKTHTWPVRDESRKKKRATTIDNDPSLQRKRESGLFLSMPKVSHDFHRHLAIELEGDNPATDKTLKRQSQSLSDVSFLYDLKVSEDFGVSSRDCPIAIESKAGPLPTLESVMALQGQANPDAPSDSSYKVYVPQTGVVDDSFKACVQQETAFSEEVSALAAQKLKNRISAGFMPARISLLDAIQAATHEQLVYMSEMESPTEDVENYAENALPPAPSIAMAAQETMSAAVEVDEPLSASSDALIRSDSTTTTIVKVVEPMPVTYQTLRRVRAARVELRSLARPLQLGGSNTNVRPVSDTILDVPVPTATTSNAQPTFRSRTEEDSSWNWGRFVDTDYEDPAVAHSRRFREKKQWAKKNTGPLIEFENKNWEDAERKVNKRQSLMSLMKEKTVDELLSMFEGK